MKLVVEPKDIKEVRRTAAEYYDVTLNDDQAKNLIVNNAKLSAHLYEDGYLDTVGRELLADILVSWVMKDWPRYRHHPWEWPKYGHSEEYKKEFNTSFKEAATKAGLILGASWE